MSNPPTFKDGVRVRDRLKLPKPGDECVTGVLMGDPSEDGTCSIKWDEPIDGFRTQTVSNIALLEVIDS